jgi:MSHA biogenesis protein MshI
MRFFSKAKKNLDARLAFAPAADGIVAAAVRRPAGSRPSVISCDFQALGNTPVAELLPRLAQFANASSFRCSMLLPARQYQMLTVEAPNVPQDELKTAVRWRMKDMLDFHVDDATIDVMSIPVEKGGHGRHPMMIVVAARNSVVREQQELYTASSVPLSVIDIPEMAQRNISMLLEPEGRGLAMLSVDDGGSLLTVTYGGELYLGRRIDVTLQQVQDQNDDQRMQALDRLMLELQRSLDHFERQFSFVTIAKLLLAPGAADALQTYLASNLYMPVSTFSLDEVLDISAEPALANPEFQARCFLAIGGALRQEVVE